jgi:lipid-binding SYLF domain-containing protein
VSYHPGTCRRGCAGSSRRYLWGLIITLIAAATTFAPVAASAQTLSELETRIGNARIVMENVAEMPDTGIPADLLTRARGIVIFPRVMKAAIVLGVSFGQGVVVRRDGETGAWSKPCFFQIRGGSLGAQVGAQALDLILLVMSEEGMQALLENQFTLGADVAIAAGPIGREASATTDLQFDAAILSYSRTKGLFAGISLQGAVVQPNDEANRIYHGPGLSVQDIFYEGRGSLTDNGRNLLTLLRRITVAQ